jgi:hypothetical protein
MPLARGVGSGGVLSKMMALATQSTYQQVQPASGQLNNSFTTRYFVSPSWNGVVYDVQKAFVEGTNKTLDIDDDIDAIHWIRRLFQLM